MGAGKGYSAVFLKPLPERWFVLLRSDWFRSLVGDDPLGLGRANPLSGKGLDGPDGCEPLKFFLSWHARDAIPCLVT